MRSCRRPGFASKASAIGIANGGDKPHGCFVARTARPGRAHEGPVIAVTCAEVCAHRWAVADRRVRAIDLVGLGTDPSRFSTLDHLYFPHKNGQVPRNLNRRKLLCTSRVHLEEAIMPTSAGGDRVTIAEQATQLQQSLVDLAPVGVLDAFRVEQDNLQADGVPAGVAKPGDPLPAAELLDVHGAPVSLAQALGRHRAVIVLYRGTWCPYCNLALRTYQEELLPELAQRGVTLIAISPQKPDDSLSMQEKNDLRFTVLSDPGNQIASALGVLTAPSEDARAAQHTLGIDLSDVNADGSYGIPMPTVVVADQTAGIRWIDVHPNYASRTEVADILMAVDADA
jgi:peroxiredoxin